MTDSIGHYSVRVPSPGTYVLCVSDRDHHLVSSCEWRAYQHVVRIRQEGTVVEDFSLDESVTLRVVISDPISVLHPETELDIIAASADGSFAHARRLPSTSNDHVFTLTLVQIRPIAAAGRALLDRSSL